MRTIILHYHLFKNAGTSLDHILKGNFGDAWVTREFPNSNRPEGNTPEVETWIRDNPDAVAFSTHTAVGPVPKIDGVRVISIMLLRDPVARIKSAYGFERTQNSDTFGSVLAKHTDLEGYVKVRLSLIHDRQCRNFQTTRLARLRPGPAPELERAIEALSDLAIVGLVADFSGTMGRFAALIAEAYPDFHWSPERRNTAGSGAPKSMMDPDLEALIRQENHDDFRLLHTAENTITAAS